MACSQAGEELHAATQPPPEGGGGVHWAEPITPLPAPEQGHSHEEPEEGSAVQLVCAEAGGDHSA